MSNLQTQIDKFEKLSYLRKKQNLSEDETQFVSSYYELSDNDITENTKFFKQLSLGWIYLEELSVDYTELDLLYNSSNWIPIYENSDYRNSQSYAEIKTPNFIKQQINLDFYVMSCFLKIHANSFLPKHNHEIGRSTSLCIPYKGEQNQIPLTFFDDHDNIISQVYINKPTLINTNIKHGIDVTSKMERTNYNLNFDFPYNFETVADILVRRMKL